jgi:signal transduction histidine kinase
MQARERERSRWAREIHDETVQGLGALRLKLANARDLNDANSLDQAVEDVLEGLGAEIDGLRHLITELRPAALDDLGLPAALDALARRAQAVDGLHVSTEIDLRGLGDDGRLDAELESTIYRVIQEALSNVGKHAQASSALIGVQARDGFIRVHVTDDGRGLPQAPRTEPRSAEEELKGGFGMSGMRERAELVGGELDVGTADLMSGKGTTVSLIVPLSGRPLALAESAHLP